MPSLRTFRIAAEVERPDLRSAIAITEQLVEHGYVDFARVIDDADPSNPPATSEVEPLVLSPREMRAVFAIISNVQAFTLDNIKEAFIGTEGWTGEDLQACLTVVQRLGVLINSNLIEGS